MWALVERATFHWVVGYKQYAVSSMSKTNELYDERSTKETVSVVKATMIEGTNKQ